jgi:hypothetical protein
MNEFQAHELATMIWSHSSTLHAYAGRAMPGDGADPNWRYVDVGLDADTDLIIEKTGGEWTFKLSHLVGQSQAEITHVIPVTPEHPDDLEDVTLLVIEVARRFFEGEFGPVADDAPAARAAVLKAIYQRLRGSRP